MEADSLSDATNLDNLMQRVSEEEPEQPPNVSEAASDGSRCSPVS
jgi:hypothetical protein